MPLSSTFNDYDFFAVQPSLRIKGRDQMGSMLGFLLTFLTFACLFGLTIYLFVMMLLRNNPTVTLSEVVTNAFNGDNVPIAMDNSSFYFGFGLYTEDVVSDPEIVNITFSGYNFTYVPPDQLEPNNFSMDAVLCDWYNQHGQWGNQGYCINKDFNILSGLQGPDHAVVQSLNIYFSPCSRTTGGRICRDRLKIDEIFRESAFRVTYTNPSINSNSVNDPITINYVNYEEYILPGFTKTLTFFVTKVRVITDKGWLFQRTTQEEAVIVENQRTTIQPRYDENTTLFKFVITANDKVIIYNRSYTKIQDVFGEITGLASFIVLILALFARPYFQFKTTEALVNSMYDVMIKEDAHSSVIGIVDQNSGGSDNDKKGPPDNGAGNAPRSNNTLKKSISTRSKSRKIGIEEHATRTSCAALEIQTTSKSEGNAPKRQEQPEVIDIVMPSEGPPQVTEPNDRPSPKSDKEGLIEIELEKVDPNVENAENAENTENPAPPPLPGPAMGMALASLESRYKIDISFREWLLSFIRPQMQVKILQEAEELLSRNLDIITIARNISEINKLKECLLTDQQRILFDHLPHSFVLLDPETQKKSSQEERGDGRAGEENAEDKVKEAYNTLKESENKTTLDSKILAMYEKKCLNFSAITSIKEGT